MHETVARGDQGLMGWFILVAVLNMKVREDFSAVTFEQGPPKEVKEEAKLVSRKRIPCRGNSQSKSQCQLLSWVGAKKLIKVETLGRPC